LRELQNVEQKPYDELLIKYDELKKKHYQFQQDTYELLDYNRNVLKDLAQEIEMKQKLEDENLSLRQSIIQLNEKNQELILKIKRGSLLIKVLKKIKRMLKLK
jgi:hypothetical protein